MVIFQTDFVSQLYWANVCGAAVFVAVFVWKDASYAASEDWRCPFWSAKLHPGKACLSL